MNTLTIMSNGKEIHKNIIGVYRYHPDRYLTSLLFETEDNEIIWYVEFPVRLEAMLQNPRRAIPSYQVKDYMWFKFDLYTHEFVPCPDVKECTLTEQNSEYSKISDQEEIVDIIVKHAKSLKTNQTTMRRSNEQLD